MALSLAEVIAAKKAATANPTPIAIEASKPSQPPAPAEAPSRAASILAEAATPEVPTVLVPMQSINYTSTVPNHEDIIPRIRALESLSLDVLDNEMKLLKEALLQNPDAVALMLPEDIGACVAALRRITGDAVVKATTKEPKASKKKLTADEMEAAWNEL